MHPDWEFLDEDYRARLTEEFLSRSVAEIEFQQRVMGRNLNEAERIAMMRQSRHAADQYK